MSGRIGLLGGLLAAQVVIIAGLLLASGVGSDASAPHLLSFDPTNVTKLSVSGEGETVGMARDGDVWRLQGGAPNGLPA
ncbi:MAG: hypothetical protein OXH37_00190, partial [Gammaproteobacteria bacterium]|nr:hypothetical protein [Gammaproteobacteria bacterium]